jgi:hypothetical protein
MNVVPRMWKGTLILVHRDLAVDDRFGALRSSVDLAVNGGAETLRRRFSEAQQHWRARQGGKVS